MSTQSQVQLALAAWINDDREQFKTIIKAEMPNILDYHGRGDIWTYFLPALLIANFWNDLQDIGFPMEKIVNSESDVVGWLDWSKSVDYMAQKDPDSVFEIIRYDFSEENLSPDLFNDDENLYITLDYYNSELRGLMENAIETYLNRSDEDWKNILSKLKNKFPDIK